MAQGRALGGALGVTVAAAAGVVWELALRVEVIVSLLVNLIAIDATCAMDSGRVALAVSARVALLLRRAGDTVCVWRRQLLAPVRYGDVGGTLPVSLRCDGRAPSMVGHCGEN